MLINRIALVLTSSISVFFASVAISEECTTHYPFVAGLSGTPSRGSIDFDLLSQVYQIDWGRYLSETDCLQHEDRTDQCLAAYRSDDGMEFEVFYSDITPSDLFGSYSLRLQVLGREAFLAPILTDEGMYNLGYSPMDDGNTLYFTIFHPKGYEDQYNAIAPLYPLLMRAVRVQICEN